MIDYKLSKQLKDSGFPQTVNSIRFESHYFKGKLSPKTISFRGLEILGKDTVLIPTLSELIEECGDEFGELRNKGDVFMAGGGKMDGVDEITWEFEEYDKIREVAMAKLWLELNEGNRR